MPIGLASDLEKKDPRRKQIQAVGSDNLFRRLSLVGSLLSSQLRLFARSRRKTLDVGLSPEEGAAGLESGTHVRSFWLVQGYLLLLLLLDTVGSIVLLLAGISVLYSVLVHLGGMAYPPAVTWVTTQPLLPALMHRVGHLTAWVPGLLRWFAGLLQQTHLPYVSRLASHLNWPPLLLIPSLVGFLLCRGIIRTLRANLVGSLREVL